MLNELQFLNWVCTSPPHSPTLNRRRLSTQHHGPTVRLSPEMNKYLTSGSGSNSSYKMYYEILSPTNVELMRSSRNRHIRPHTAPIDASLRPTAGVRSPVEATMHLSGSVRPRAALADGKKSPRERLRSSSFNRYLQPAPLCGHDIPRRPKSTRKAKTRNSHTKTSYDSTYSYTSNNTSHGTNHLIHGPVHAIQTSHYKGLHA